MTILTAIAEALTSPPEDPRLASRRDRRLRMAELGREMERRRAAIAKLASLDQKKKTADAEHSAKCAPLIAERDEIEARVNARQADRQTADPCDEARLGELEKAIDVENDALSIACAAVDLEKKRLAAQLGGDTDQSTLGRLSGEMTNIRNDLRSEGLGNPRLLGRKRGLEHVLGHLLAASAAAAAGHLSDGGGATLRTRNQQAIDAVSAEVGRWLADAQKQYDEVLRDLFEE